MPFHATDTQVLAENRPLEAPAASSPPAHTQPQSKTPTLDPYTAGQLSMLLALGLSFREAERWVDLSDTTIGRVARENLEFAATLREYTLLTQLHPFLRLYLAIGNSWQASDWFYSYLRRRTGEATVETLLAKMLADFEQIRPHLFSDEVLKTQFDAYYPIGEA